MRNCDVTADEVEFSHECEGLRDFTGQDFEAYVGCVYAEGIEGRLMKFW